MDTAHQVPKKLVPGMKVVVWIRPETKLFPWEYDRGLRVGKWFKAEIKATGNHIGGMYILINGVSVLLDSQISIVVRAVEKRSQSEASKARARKVYRDKTQKLAALKAASKTALSN
ncbi:MAG: hypothetical protein [Bacteriophage sp.]|nr:MAG: hypothetical protein [Bacteriophage sp.]